MNPKIKNVLAISAILSLLFGFLAAIFGGAIFSIILGTSFGLGIGLAIFIVAFLTAFVPLVVIGILFVSIPRTWAIFLGLAIVLVGLVLWQPEIDIVGIGGLLFALMPMNRRLVGPKH